jgi:hypothetical protein
LHSHRIENPSAGDDDRKLVSPRGKRKSSFYTSFFSLFSFPFFSSFLCCLIEFLFQQSHIAANEAKLGGGRSQFFASMSSSRQVRGAEGNAPNASQPTSPNSLHANSGGGGGGGATTMNPTLSPRVHHSLQDLSPRHPDSRNDSPRDRSTLDETGHGQVVSNHGGTRERKTGVSHGKNTVSPIAKQVQAAHQERERERAEAEREAENPISIEKEKQQLQQLRDMMQQVQIQLQLKQQHPSDSPVYQQQVQELSDKLTRLQTQFQLAQAKDRERDPTGARERGGEGLIGTHSVSPIISPRPENPNLLRPDGGGAHEMTRLQPVNPNRFTPPNPNRYTPPNPNQPQGRVNPNRFTQGRNPHSAASQYIPPNAMMVHNPQQQLSQPQAMNQASSNAPTMMSNSRNQTGSPHNSGRMSLPLGSNPLHQGNASGRYTPPNRSLSYVNSNSARTSKRPATGPPGQYLVSDLMNIALDSDLANLTPKPAVQPTTTTTTTTTDVTTTKPFSDTPLRSPSMPQIIPLIPQIALSASTSPYDSTSGDFQLTPLPGDDKDVVSRAFPNRRPMGLADEMNGGGGGGGGMHLSKRESDPSIGGSGGNNNSGLSGSKDSPVSPRPGSQREWKTRLTERGERQNNQNNQNNSSSNADYERGAGGGQSTTTSQNGNHNHNPNPNPSRSTLTQSRGDDRAVVERPNAKALPGMMGRCLFVCLFVCLLLLLLFFFFC